MITIKFTHRIGYRSYFFTFFIIGNKECIKQFIQFFCDNVWWHKNRLTPNLMYIYFRILNLLNIHSSFYLWVLNQQTKLASIFRMKFTPTLFTHVFCCRQKENTVRANPRSLAKNTSQIFWFSYFYNKFYIK